MSYTLIFARKTAGQSWAEAIEAAREASQDSGRPPDVTVWTRVTGRVHGVLPDAEEFAGDTFAELDDDATGIQISARAYDAEITVPSHHQDDTGTAIVEMIYQVGQILQEETGLRGYDPQTGVSLDGSAGQLQLAAGAYANAARMFRRYR